MANVHRVREAPPSCEDTQPSCEDTPPSRKQKGRNFHNLQKALKNTEQQIQYAGKFARAAASIERERLDTLCPRNKIYENNDASGYDINYTIYQMCDAAYEKAYNDFMSTDKC